MNFRPLSDRVLVVPICEDEKTPGGIVIPETSRRRSNTGKVLAVGPGARNMNGELIPTSILPGQIVHYGVHSGTDIKINGETHVILRESDILGVVSE